MPLTTLTPPSILSQTYTNTCRDLLGTLEDSAEDLCLEYFATLDAEEAAAAAAAVKPEPVPAPA